MMKIDYLKEKKELVATVLLAVSVIAVLLTVAKVTGFFVTSARAEGAVKQAIEQSKPDAKHLTAQIDRSKQVADALKKNNLFAPPPPKANPIKAVMGILGDEALINGKWYKVGAKVGDAKVVAIAPDAVTTEWNGQQKTFNPIDGAGSGSSGPARSAKRSSARSSSSKKSKSAAPKLVTVQRRLTSNRVSGPVTRDTFAQLGAGLGVAMPPRVQENLVKYWNGLSDQEKTRSQESWNRMSDRERRQTLENAAREMR
jgi:hypothetical protein